MDSTFYDLMEFWKKPSLTEMLVDALLCAVPIWLAVMIGLLIGWSWRPRWTGILFLGLRSKFRFVWTTVPPGFGARRLYFAITALSTFSLCRTIWSRFKRRNGKVPPPEAPLIADAECSKTSGSLSDNEEREHIVTEDDLEHFLNFLGGQGISMDWQSMMEKKTSNMSYQAWCHDPQNGSPFVLRSRTVFEDATPELVRDFFWDNDFRPKWDPMIAECKVLEEYSRTGTVIVHWVRKFPFFCSDREYIIGQRIWEDKNAYYCVTKGVPCPSVPKRTKPKRVDAYFSSWVIRAVESCNGDGKNSACEVIFIHHEDMGIPKDVAKLGVRHGMWRTVKRMHGGMRTYQSMRLSGCAVGRSAAMATITTKISVQDCSDSVIERQERHEIVMKEQRERGFDWRMLVVGGAIALVCVHSGAVGRALLLGAGQRFGRR